MSRLDDIAKQISDHKQPPVHQWQPEHHGEIDIRINAQGFWFHEGDPINREELVRLFASILWCEDGQHFLQTPVEKLKIAVEDSPFLVHQMEHVEDAWVAVTNVHEQVIVGDEHPVELRSFQGQMVPYLRVRYDLWARVNRSIYYQLVSAALEAQQDESAPLVLISQGYEFEVGRV